jgi:uroporphyrin-III C-methyltransferase/precorrin-2 dehydrogenase/sirohydrochlorin ferrochelatase
MTNDASDDDTGTTLFPLFLKLGGRSVLLVGGGPVATGKARALAQAGARVTIVAPAVTPELDALATARGWRMHARGFAPADLDGVWLAIAAAPAEVNRAVGAAAEAARVFVVAVDDPAASTAYGAGVVRRAGVTIAISSGGDAPAMTGLLREGIEAVLPDELDLWMEEARRTRLVWRAEGVPMPERRPRLLAALNRIYDAASAAALAPVSPAPAAPAARAGRVTLVGAGPGAPDLLTVRGARALAEADLVLYDALSSEEMRAYAPGARWFYVGKRACRQSIAQDVLNRILVKEAQRGRRVVRLKCGDPFVFGRGGEEALALAEAGIPCEIVPGISSAIAAAGLAGIPVTHRGVASAFTVISGHHEAVYGPIVAALPAGAMTLVFLMGLGRRADIARTLVERGWSRETPAAVILGAATPAAWHWTGTLADLAEVALPASSSDERRQPGLLVIGDVVAIGAQIAVTSQARSGEPSETMAPADSGSSAGTPDISTPTGPSASPERSRSG